MSNDSSGLATNPPATEESVERGLYAFDAETFEPEIQFGKSVVQHRLRRPSTAKRDGYKPPIDEFAEHEKRVVVERVSDEKGDGETLYTGAGQANQWLWDRLATHVRGHKDLGEGWIELTPEIKARIRGAHKEAAIRSLSVGKAQVLIERTEQTCDGGRWFVLLKIGQGEPFAFEALLVLREWMSSERDAFKSATSGIRLGKRNGQGTVKPIPQLPAYAKLFGAVFEAVEYGATVNGQPYDPSRRAAWLNAIFPWWQRFVLDAVIPHWEGEVRD